MARDTRQSKMRREQRRVDDGLIQLQDELQAGEDGSSWTSSRPGSDDVDHVRTRRNPFQEAWEGDGDQRRRR